MTSNSVERIFLHYLSQDAKLIAAGFPPTSEWWKGTVRRFYSSGKRTAVLRVGRRGGKSSTLARVAVNELLNGEHKIPPGDTGYAVFISVSRDEAAQRIRTVKAILDALKVRYTAKGDVVQLEGRPLAFKVFTATIAGVSGPTAVFVAGDELAKWKDKDSGANPAREVVASVKPTVATQPNARVFLSSSAFSQLDYHYELFERGDTDDQFTAEAPTWEANPTITEAETRKLEPDERVWLREFAGQPQAAELAVFAPADIDRCFRIRTDTLLEAPKILAIDASSGKRDVWAWAIIGWKFWDDSERWSRNDRGEVRFTPWGDPIQRLDWKPPPETRGYLKIYEVGGVRDAFKRNIPQETIIRDLSVVAARHQIRNVYGDQFGAYGLQSLFSAHGLTFTEQTWSSPTKTAAVALLRRMVTDDQVSFAEHEGLKRELYAYEEKIDSNGNLTHDARNFHADYISTVLTALMREASEGLPRSGIRGFTTKPRPPANDAAGWFMSSGLY